MISAKLCVIEIHVFVVGWAAQSCCSVKKIDLIHHLYSRVPVYRYRRVCRNIHDWLVENDAQFQFGYESAKSYIAHCRGSCAESATFLMNSRAKLLIYRNSKGLLET